MPAIASTTVQLENGLAVVLHEDHSLPMAAVNVWYHVGSQNEEPARTGFAHLFEHIMFKGSKHHNREYFLPLQEIGANVNGSTTVDRTNYYENVPAEYLELALWLESDRMGFLLDALDEGGFATEREVVKNERRQSYENRPYGLASQEIRAALFPPSHPYHWQTIGSQEHLDAASLEDVKRFFRRFYAPNNASLCLAGDIDLGAAEALARRYFGSLPPAPPVPRIGRWTPHLEGEVQLRLEDRVQLARVYFAWVGPPRFDVDEAPLDVLTSILAEGRSSRLYRQLVYERQIAREVNARFDAMEIAGELRLDATVAAGASVSEVEQGLLAEVDRLARQAPEPQEVQRAVNRLEAGYTRQLQSIGGFGGRADLLNYFQVFAGDAGRVNSDVERYLAVTPEDVRRVAQRWLTAGRVRLVVSPRASIAATSSTVDRAVQPGPGAERGFHAPVPRRFHLAGGIDLLLVERHELPIVAVAVHFSGGAASDPTGAPGLTSLAARLLTEGTTHRSSTDIADQSDALAARLNLAVHREFVSASTEVLTRHWPAALELLVDVLTNPTFPEREVERIRTERITDLRRLGDDANALAERASTAVLYGGGSAYGHPSAGREAAVAEFSRTELADQYLRTILHRRPTVVIAGDVDGERVARQLEAAFAGWEGQAAALAPSDAAPQQQAATLYLVDKPGAAQSVIAAGQLAVPRLHADYLPLVVMNMAFGGQFTARLNMNLRERKGYTYGYRSRFDWRAVSSTFVAGGAVQTAVTKEALIETLREFEDLVERRPLAADEFEKAQLGLIRGYPPTFETPGHIIGRLLDLVHYGLADDEYAGQIDRLRTVTLADVHRAAAEHIHPNQLAIVVVGDLAVIEPGVRELGLPVVHLDREGDPIDAPAAGSPAVFKEGQS